MKATLTRTQHTDEGTFSDPAHFGYFTAVVALAVAVLRWVTALPLLAK